VKAGDQFHTGIVVDDLDSTLSSLSALFGYEWCAEIGGPLPVKLPTGDAILDLRFAYSRSIPRLEIIRTVPGSLWEPAAGSGIHHLGYWSDDVAADSAALAGKGYAVEATGVQPDGVPYWAYHRGASGPRIELVSRTVQAGLEQYWATPTP
jgi:Glyoxalase/Bleomycin resistance protein/Dioxygenase superfamily